MVAASRRLVQLTAEVAPSPQHTHTHTGYVKRRRLSVETLEDRRVPAGALPTSLWFEPNLGQAPDGVSFFARAAGYTLGIDSEGAGLHLLSATGTDVSLNFLSPLSPLGGEGSGVRGSEGQGLLPGVSNYANNANPITGVPHFSRVVVDDLYPNIDVVYHTGASGRMEFDLVVAPGADPADVRFQFSADVKPRIGKRGNLILNLASPLRGEGAAQSGVRGSSSPLSPLRGEGPGVRGDRLKLLAPHTYQEIDGQRVTVESRFVRHGNRVGFRVGSYDHTQPLIIDPELDYGTYLGGTADDAGLGIAVDDAGSAYVTGWTKSLQIPAPPPPPGMPGGGGGPTRSSKDVFIAKLTPDGQALEYITYLNGDYDDIGYGIVVNDDAEAFVTGVTYSENFTVSQDAAIDEPVFALGGVGSHAFLTKLNADGTVGYSTYVAWVHAGIVMWNDLEVNYFTTNYTGYDLDVDGDGNMYVTGGTFGLYDNLGSAPADIGHVMDPFVVRFRPDGTIYDFNYELGGIDGADEARGVAVDEFGIMHVTGWTESSDFPTANGLDTTLGGPSDAFLMTLGATLPAPPVMSTFLGGSGEDEAFGLAMDCYGNLYLTGVTSSSDFPTTPGVLQVSLAGARDAFVTKFNADAELEYSTYVGAGNDDEARAITVDSIGQAIIVGETNSADWDMVDAMQPVFGGLSDGFMVQLVSDGTSVTLSTYLGGMENDSANAIAFPDHDPCGEGVGSPYVTGYTNSEDFPTEDPLQESSPGGIDAFVVQPDVAHPHLVSLDYVTDWQGSRKGVLTHDNPNGDGGSDPTDTPAFLGGWRVFPDAESWTFPDSSRNIVRIRATVTPTKTGIPVYFRSFDVDDPATNTWIDEDGDPGKDNRSFVGGTDYDQPAFGNPGYMGRLRPVGGAFKGDGEVVTVHTTVVGGQAIAEVELAVSFSPGDNLRIAASLNRDELEGDGTGPSLNDTTDVPTVGAVTRFDFTGLLTEQLSVWRRIHLEQDRMIKGSVLGDRQSGMVTAAPYLIPLTVLWAVPTDIAIGSAGEYENGILRTAGGVNYAIVGNTSGANATVITTAAPPVGAITIFQDDFEQDNPDPPVLRVNTEADFLLYNYLQESVIRRQNVFADAYVEPEHDILDDFDEISVPAIAHFGGDAADFENHIHTHVGSLDSKTPIFWTAYVTTGYESLTSEDNDSQTESTTMGVTPLAGLLGRDASMILLEAVRDSALDHSLDHYEAQARVAAHEVGHQANLAKEGIPNSSFKHRDNQDNLMHKNPLQIPETDIDFHAEEIAMVRSSYMV